MMMETNPETKQLEILSWAEFSQRVEDEQEFQKTLLASDPRHKAMCCLCEDGTHVLLFWGGYEYAIDLNTIRQPEDLLWLILHLSKKTWKQSSAYRVGKLVEIVAAAKGWQQYTRLRPANEAPKAKVSVAAERAKMSAAIRYDVIRRDGYRCRACGFSVQDGAHLHVDHIIPVSKGGLTAMNNLQTLCTVCNLGKAAK